MKALIDPTHIVYYTSGWNIIGDKYLPVYTEVPNSARVCQTNPDDQIFAVAEPFFWQDCSDEIIADVYYFNTQDLQYVLTPTNVQPPKN